jgi:hypothetical protein
MSEEQTDPVSTDSIGRGEFAGLDEESCAAGLSESSVGSDAVAETAQPKLVKALF